MSGPIAEASARALLGSLLVDPARITEVRSLVAPGDFYQPAHEAIYAAALAVFDAGGIPDVPTLAAELERQKQLAMVGGVAELTTFENDLPDYSRAEAYARDVREAARLRRAQAAVEAVRLSGVDRNSLAELLEVLAEEPQDDRVRVWSLRELLEHPESTTLPPPVIPKLAWPSRVTLLSAHEKLGKSTLVAAAVGALTAGGYFLDERTNGDGPVLWATEEAPVDVARRLKRFSANPDRVDVMVWGATPLAALRAEAERRKPCLLVVDTLTALAEHDAPDSGSASAWALIMRPLVRIARDTGCALLILHHARKTDDSYRDSSEIGAAVDVIAEMSGTATGTLRRIQWRGRYGRGSFAVRLKKNRYMLTEESEAAELEAAVFELVAENPGCSQRAVEDGVTGRRDDVRNALRVLLDKRRIEDRGRETRHAYYVREDAPRAGARPGEAENSPLAPVLRGERDSDAEDALAERAPRPPLEGGAARDAASVDRLEEEDEGEELTRQGESS